MYTTIRRWGNSRTIRIPKDILEAASLNENDRVVIKAEQDYIIIRKAKKRRLTLEERFEGYSGDYKCTEANTGDPVGNEVL